MCFTVHALTHIHTNTQTKTTFISPHRVCDVCIRVLVMQSSSRTIILGSAWTTPQGTSNKLPVEQRLWPWSHERHHERDKMQDWDSANTHTIHKTEKHRPSFPTIFIWVYSLFKLFLSALGSPMTETLNTTGQQHQVQTSPFFIKKKRAMKQLHIQYILEEPYGTRQHQIQRIRDWAAHWMERWRLTLDYNRAVCHGNHLDRESNIFNRLNSIK